VTDVLELAERCEKANGPDRRIDAAICRLVDLPKCQYPDCLPDVLARIIERVESDGNQDSDVPHYTSSIDAAMTLVLEGWWLTLDRYFISDNPKPDSRAWRVWLNRLAGDLDGTVPVITSRSLHTARLLPSLSAPLLSVPAGKQTPGA
jgi:hypothetical protein